MKTTAFAPAAFDRAAAARIVLAEAGKLINGAPAPTDAIKSDFVTLQDFRRLLARVQDAISNQYGIVIHIAQASDDVLAEQQKGKYDDLIDWVLEQVEGPRRGSGGQK